MRNKKIFHSGRAVFFLLVFICCVIAVAVLKVASAIILPFVIAILLAFVMFPLIKLMDKIRIPRIISIFLVVCLIAAGMYLIGMVLFTSGKMIVVQAPQYEGRFKEIYDWAANLFDLPNDEALTLWQNLWDQEAIRAFVSDFTISLSNFFFKFISSTILLVFFIVFLLVETGIFREKLRTAFENRIEQINRMGNEIISQVSRYLAAKFLISLINAVIFVIAFQLVGLEFAIVWGVIQFMLNFIPTLGSIVAGAAISLFAILQFWPDPTPIIIVIVIVLATNMILGNLIDPKVIGDNVGLSPLMVIISLSLWGWIWGFAGMVLAVPMTVIIKIVCENIPIMEPVSIIMGSRKSVLAKKIESEKAETQP
ncbi:MAG: AI-2E family transporter [Treponema sp.]|nr:AI-2E family transporter [Treponema sp.]